VSGRHEVVCLRHTLQPGLEVALVELDDATAARADEVMVMALAAPAVAELSGVVRERVDDALLGQEPQRAVDGREAEPLPATAQAFVQLLRGDVVAFTHQLGEHDHPLARSPHSDTLQEADDLRLLAARHGAMLAPLITRIVLTTLAGALATVATAGCGGPANTEASPGARQVVAGLYPLAFAAEEVDGSEVEVTNLTPAGAEPHDLELTPSEVEKIYDADLVLYLGGGFQPGIEEAVDASGATALDALEGIALREKDGHVDPHIWLDPVRFAQVVERIGAELGSGAAAGRLVSRLHGLDRQYRDGLAHCRGRELVTAHDAFGYLADRYGLEVIPITGVTPEAEPSPQDLEAIAHLVEERGVTTIFTEPLLSPEVAETVAREAGAQTAVLNPAEGLTEEQLSRGEDYFSMMKANLAALREGLGCS
jgi:zinc transport system substrate-binding protein